MKYLALYILPAADGLKKSYQLKYEKLGLKNLPEGNPNCDSGYKCPVSCLVE